MKQSSLLSILILTFSSGMILSGCNGTPESLCQGKLAQLSTDLDNASTSLQVWMPSASSDSDGRSIASFTEMADTDRQSWAAWSRIRLQEAQHYMDLADQDPRLKQVVRELSSASDDLVEFHAYALRGRTVSMMRALASVRLHENQAVSLVCAPTLAAGK